MEIVKYLIWFVAFSFIGWVIDTTYRSIKARKYAPGTWLPFLAISYGTGGIILILLYTYSNYSIPLQLLFGGILLTILEFILGILTKAILGRRLWDYSKNPYNIMGHTDSLHAFYWFILAALFKLLIYLY